MAVSLSEFVFWAWGGKNLGLENEIT